MIAVVRSTLDASHTTLLHTRDWFWRPKADLRGHGG